jgi:hypothetical protein
MSSDPSQPSGNVDPNLRMSYERGRTRYPSPFFDVSQQYIPPTVKEMFKWVYFYATNNSFLGPALNKIARYPITDLIIEDHNAKVADNWKTLLNNTLQIKTFEMEVNLDLTTYGNAFVSINYPFSRFLVCQGCKHRHPWKTVSKRIENLSIKIKCHKCGYNGIAKIHDVQYKSAEGVRLIRLNPEFIDIKYNDSTGRHVYLYSIPDKLKRMIMSGDSDIIEDTPEIYLESIRQKKKIRLSNQNVFHLKRPSLAGKDMGWGMPLIATALKDLFHYYTLRRGQEAVMLEHITPFDILFPQANGKFDPYVHSDLTSWKAEIQRQIAAKRKDPNYKAVLPFPVGFERIGGDGKNLMLTPELDFLAKTIIGTCGIPQEFVYGGTMNWSGSSVALRTLENEFLHHRSQLLQMIIWIVDRLRVYLDIMPPKSIKFSDFKMADDMQKLQLLFNAADKDKLDWETIFKELGYDYEVVKRKIEEQKLFEAKLTEVQLVRQAEAQAKAQQVALRYQQKVQGSEQPQTEQEAAQESIQETTIQAWAKRLAAQSVEQQQQALARLEQQDPQFAAKIKAALAGLSQTQPATSTKTTQKPKAGEQIDMRQAPEQKPPRRQGGI